MVRKKNAEECCEDSSEEYRVEAVVSIDERGQMVLPKDLRESFGLKAGDKLALVVMHKGGRACCIHMFRAGEFNADVKRLLGSGKGD
ncbi:MAG: HgcAB-associated protein [Methanomassiliicoccales archaeon]